MMRTPHCPLGWRCSFVDWPGCCCVAHAHAAGYVLATAVLNFHQITSSSPGNAEARTGDSGLPALEDQPRGCCRFLVAVAARMLPSGSAWLVPSPAGRGIAGHTQVRGTYCGRRRRGLGAGAQGRSGHRSASSRIPRPGPCGAGSRRGVGREPRRIHAAAACRAARARVRAVGTARSVSGAARDGAGSTCHAGRPIFTSRASIELKICEWTSVVRSFSPDGVEDEPRDVMFNFVRCRVPALVRRSAVRGSSSPSLDRRDVVALNASPMSHVVMRTRRHRVDAGSGS